MAAIDRLNSLASETTLAIKAPCVVATTGVNITLSGIQVIDGVTVGNNSERVLVKDQTDTTQNNIYIASSGNWTLAQDAGGNTDWVNGTLVPVASGLVNSGATFRQVGTDNPIVIGTSSLAFLAALRIGDTSSAISVPAHFWFPTFFGALGAISDTVWRLNRLFVGTAAAASSDITAPVNQPTTKSWLDTALGFGVTSLSQMVVLSATGQLAILAGSDTAHYRATIGSASGGSAALTGFGRNSDTVSGSPIGLGLNAIGYRMAGVGGVTLGAQMDMNNAGSVVVLTPHGGITGGATLAALLTSGAYSIGTANVSAALGIGPASGGGHVFNKGLIFFKGGLDTSVGHAGVAIEMARAYSLRWLNDSDTSDGEIYADSTGINMTTSQLVVGGAVVGVVFGVGANQVVGARVTGYAAMTGTPDKASTFATGSVTLAQLAGRVMQLQADLTTHGLIGA